MLTLVENLSNDNMYHGSDDEEDIPEQHQDYKGIYFDDNNEQQYYEGGAHFSYKIICEKLEKIICDLSPDRKGKSIYEEEFTTPEGSSVAKTKADSGKFVENNRVTNYLNLINFL